MWKKNPSMIYKVWGDVDLITSSLLLIKKYIYILLLCLYLRRCHKRSDVTAFWKWNRGSRIVRTSSAFGRFLHALTFTLFFVLFLTEANFIWSGNWISLHCLDQLDHAENVTRSVKEEILTLQGKKLWNCFLCQPSFCPILLPEKSCIFKGMPSLGSALSVWPVTCFGLGWL